MRVYMFEARFAPPIESGVKSQTVRKVGRRLTPRPGEILSLRVWSGVPYRSPHRVLGHAPCVAVEPVRIAEARGVRALCFGPITVELSGCCVSDVEAFAVGDGFASAADMLDYYRARRTLPFEGTRIRWAPIGVARWEWEGECAGRKTGL